MASEIKATLQKTGISANESREIPMLDLSNAAVKELVRTAERRGIFRHGTFAA